jgi:signal transduction histidine kinase
MPHDDLRVIVQQIRRMEESVQAFLEYARPRPARRAKLELRELVRQTLALIEGRAASQNVTLHWQGPPRDVACEGDCDQLQQLLLNLLLNGLEAMPQGGTLQVALAAGPDQLLLSVRDSGPGIDPQMKARLFEPFATGKESGTGLGLLLSRQIAEAHGGTLRGFNPPGGGACFELRLPLPAPHAAPQQAT